MEEEEEEEEEEEGVGATLFLFLMLNLPRTPRVAFIFCTAAMNSRRLVSRRCRSALAAAFIARIRSTTMTHKVSTNTNIAARISPEEGVLTSRDSTLSVTSTPP